MEAVGNHRAAEIDARRRRLEPPHVPTAKPELGKRVVQLKVPLVTPFARFNSNHVGSKSAILRRERAGEYVHRLYAVDRHRGSELSGGRIGRIR